MKEYIEKNGYPRKSVEFSDRHGRLVQLIGTDIYLKTNDNMEKAKHPTSKYEVACDHFDTFATVGIHETEDGHKLRLSMISESGDKEVSISLFREDVEMLTRFLRGTLDNIVKRPS